MENGAGRLFKKILAMISPVSFFWEKDGKNIYWDIVVLFALRVPLSLLCVSFGRKVPSNLLFLSIDSPIDGLISGWKHFWTKKHVKKTITDCFNEVGLFNPKCVWLTNWLLQITKHRDGRGHNILPPTQGGLFFGVVKFLSAAAPRVFRWWRLVLVAVLVAQSLLLATQSSCCFRPAVCKKTWKKSVLPLRRIGPLSNPLWAQAPPRLILWTWVLRGAIHSCVFIRKTRQLDKILFLTILNQKFEGKVGSQNSRTDEQILCQ